MDPFTFLNIKEEPTPYAGVECRRTQMDCQGPSVAVEWFAWRRGTETYTFEVQSYEHISNEQGRQETRTDYSEEHLEWEVP